MSHEPLQALIFDVDGTLADTESAHRAAFNHAFAQERIGWHWDELLYTKLLQISGGKERMAHYWKATCGQIVDVGGSGVRDTISRLHEIKTAAYESMVQDGAVALRPGVLKLIESAHKDGLILAIATTTSSVNIAALLRKAIGPDWAYYFMVIEDASTAPTKKPHPQVYLQSLQRLGLAAASCIAFEDSSNGLRSALAAKIVTVITPNSFTSDHDFTGALKILPNLQDVTVAKLNAWRTEKSQQTATTGNP